MLNFFPFNYSLAFVMFLLFYKQFLNYTTLYFYKHDNKIPEFLFKQFLFIDYTQSHGFACTTTDFVPCTAKNRLN